MAYTGSSRSAFIASRGKNDRKDHLLGSHAPRDTFIILRKRHNWTTGDRAASSQGVLSDRKCVFKRINNCFCQMETMVLHIGITIILCHLRYLKTHCDLLDFPWLWESRCPSNRWAGVVAQWWSSSLACGRPSVNRHNYQSNNTLKKEMEESHSSDNDTDFSFLLSWDEGHLGSSTVSIL